MTDPRAPRSFQERPPSVLVDTELRTGAGTPVIARVMVTNHAPEPRIIAITPLGVDTAWLPHPSRSRPVMPGESIAADLTLSPAAGTVPARYPLALAVQALSPVSEQATAPTVIAELVLVVDAPGQVAVELDPVAVTAVFGKRLSVVLHNTGQMPAAVQLEARGPHSTHVSLQEDRVEVPAGQTVRIGARVRVVRPRMFGGRARHTYTVTARGTGAARWAEGAVTSRAVLGPVGAKVGVLVTVVALWAALALVFIPKLANHTRSSQDKVASGKTSGQSASPSPSGSGGAGGQGGADGNGGGGAGGAGGAANGAGSVQLNGTVVGNAPSGVNVAIAPTSLVDEAAQGAAPLGFSMTALLGDVGKVPASARHLTAQNATAPNRTTVTAQDGAWSFPNVKAPGYYLLTFAKPGYQTQRYVVDASAAIATQPLKINLVAGKGRLSGTIRGPSGLLGGAEITITDGTNTITTSSNSRGAVGSWSVDGLSTPSSYLVSAAKDGLGTESQLVTLDAGGASSVSLTLKAGVASLGGRVTGIPNGKIPGVEASVTPVGLGGVQVTATNGTVSRTASTVTGPSTSALVGNYVLPDLVPGTYSVTFTAPGYLVQTQRVVIKRGQSQASASAVLTSAAAVVSGTVRGVQFKLDGTGDPVLDAANHPVVAALNGAGLILSDSDNTYKTTSGADGSFLFSGVAPGTYVLSAQYAGLTTGFVTVTATAGHIATASFNLTAETTTSNSTIVGFVGGATSPSNTIICNPGAPAPCLVKFVLHDSSGAEIDIHDPSAGAPADPFVPADPKAYILPASASGPTAYTISAAAGLAPGLYRLRIRAPGFLPTTITVPVPLNGIGRAPQVNLFPANTISGTVSSVGNMSGAASTFTNCVYAFPQGKDPQSVPRTLTGCDPTVAGDKCPDTGAPDIRYAEIDGATGHYVLDGLCDATYLMYVVVTNPDYLNPTATGPAPPPLATETVARGQTVNFSPHVFRLGRAVLTMSLANSASGALSSLPQGTALTATCTAPGQATVTQNVTTDANSAITVSRLGSGTWNCTITGNTTATANQIGQITGLSVALDTDALGQVTLATTVGTFYGRATTSWSGTTQPLVGTTVTVTGVTGYVNGSPQSTSAQVVTDANGCFAFSPSGAQAPAGPGACASDTAIPTRAFPLVVSTATFQAAPPAGYQPATLSVPQISGSALIGIGIVPNPVAITGVLTTNPAQDTSTTPPNPDLSTASIQVQQAAPGSGHITVKSDSTGHLTWQDSTIPDAAHPIQPGTYRLTATLPGYVPAEITFTCALTVPCDMNLTDAFVLKKLGSLTISTVDAGGTPIPDASFALYSGTTLLSTQTPVPGTNTVPFVGLTPGAAYRVHIQAAGYQFADTGTSLITLDCGGGATTITITPGGDVSCTATLTRDGAISGTVKGIFATSPATDPFNPIVGATVTVSECTTHTNVGGVDYCTALGGKQFSTVSGNGGAYRITGTGSSQGLDVGWWMVTASAAGYCAPAATAAAPCPASLPAGALGIAVEVTSAVADTTGVDPSLYVKPVTYTVTLVDQNNHVIQNATGSGITVTLIGGTTFTATSSGTGNNTVWVFTNVIPGSYTLQVTGAKLNTTTNSVNILVGVASQTYTMIVPLGANLASGTISGLQGPDPSVAPLPGAVVCMFLTAPTASSTCGTEATPNAAVATGTDGAALITTTAADGTFSIGTVPDDKFYLQVQKNGYVTYAQTSAVTYKHTQAAPPAVVQTLTRITHNVVVTVTTSSSGDDIAATAVTLTSTNPTSWVLTPQAPTTTGNAYTWTFNAVPFGDWTIKAVLPGNHFGTVTSATTNGGPAMACAATSPATTPASQTCTSAALTVPGTGSADVPAAYLLTEYAPTIAVTTAPLALDTAPPTAVTLTVGSLYTDAAFTVPAAAAALPVWVAGSHLVTATPGAAYPGWAPKSVTVTDATTKTVALTEVGGSVTVTVSGSTGYALPNNTAVAVTLTAPAGANAPPQADVKANNSGVATATFSNLPYGAGWLANATATVSVGGPPAVATPIQGTSAAFTIGATAATATISLAP